MEKLNAYILYIDNGDEVIKTTAYATSKRAITQSGAYKSIIKIVELKANPKIFIEIANTISDQITSSIEKDIILSFINSQIK